MKNFKLEKYKAQVCQTCLNHSNNPSRCNRDKKFVNRKDGEGCVIYKWNGKMLERSVAIEVKQNG